MLARDWLERRESERQRWEETPIYIYLCVWSVGEIEPSQHSQVLSLVSYAMLLQPVMCQNTQHGGLLPCDWDHP